MDSEELKKARNNLVAKDNRLIQRSRFSLTTVENKAILYLISKIQPDDDAHKRYHFNCKEFKALIRWSEDSSHSQIKDMLTKLGSAQWWMDVDDDGTEALVRWFNIVHMNRGTGDIEISFHEDMFPYLLELNKQIPEEGKFFTTYKLQNVSLMKSHYAPRIYELLKSYQYNNRQWTFENGTGSVYDLQRRIADRKEADGTIVTPENWSNWAIFKRDVLEPSIKEINKYTDIKVAYEGVKEDIHHRKTRAVRTIRFYMVGKTSPEQRETDSIIDAEYREIENKEYSLAERFFMEHEQKLEEERIENELLEEEQFDARVNNSRYPVLTSLIGKNFSDEEIGNLFQAAIKDRVAGYVDFKDWELFAVDLIADYYEIIKSDMSSTRTSLYKRLMDSIRKDYMNIADKYVKKYEKAE